jgi:uncharacterized membrane protein
MNWFFIALAAPALWAAVNHADKYIVSKYFTSRGAGSLVLFTSLSGLLFSLFILIFASSSLNIGVIPALVIALNGAILVAAFIPYMHAIGDEEASYVTALYQLIPVFAYFLAFIFLHESLTPHQIAASGLVIAGAILISLEISGTVRFKSKPFWLMILSAFMIAVNSLIFKVVALDANFWGTAFWEYIGGGVFGVLLFALVPIYRAQFLSVIRQNRLAVIGVNTSSELLNVIAKLLANYASLLAPLALVWVVNGFQPLFAFVYGIIITLFLPKIGKEDLSRKTVAQKLLAIIIIFIGVFFIFR